jgi:hypothetical protein
MDIWSGVKQIALYRALFSAIYYFDNSGNTVDNENPT